MKISKMIFALTIFCAGFVFAQEYVGSQQCGTCHPDKLADWSNSGHPYKFNPVVEGVAPVYPNFVTNFEADWMTGLDATWDDISGVIGGFGWKARFVDHTGTIAGTGSSIINPGAGHNQFNFYGGVDFGWVDYHAGDANKIYNYDCFKCHTTGATPDGSWLDGYDLGSYAEPGVGCEACHGPGYDHGSFASPHLADPNYIDLVYEFDNNNGNGLDGVLPDPNGNDITFLCGTCHNRSFTSPINASGGFIRHHEQWDEFSATAHADQGFTCATCHNPHKRVIWDGDGITMQCATCHPDNVANFNHPVDLECIDCHMPYAGKSGTTQGQSGYKGDVRSHLWKITVSSESMFSEDGSVVRDDADRQASLDLEHACLACHNDDPNDEIPDKTVDELLAFAAMMHAPADANQYVGPETCLSCHPDKSTWRTTLHANGFTVPKGENTLQDLYGIVADADGNGIDDFMDGLDLSTVDAFAQYGADAPVLGYDADTDTYTITMGELTYPVALTYGGSGMWKQRYVLKVPLADGSQSFGHYVSPVQYNEKTNEYVTYHADAWYDAGNMPIYGASTTAADIAGNSRSLEKGCSGCHFTYTDVSQTADGEWVAEAPDASAADMGITTYDIDGDGAPDLINTSCERCHGPGGGHFGDPAGIVNPADLTTQQSNDLCGFCHSRGKSFPNETLAFPFNDDEGDMHDWEVGDVWGDYYINHGGFWGDGQVEGEKQTSKKHHQQYYDFYESSKPTYVYHEVRCSECHDPHGGGEHQVVEEIDEDGIIIATEPDNNTLCLACHSTHGYFADISKEMVADYANNIDTIGAVVTQHTHHPYDPVSGPSRCTKCHMPKVAKSAVEYDIHAHTFEPIPPSKTLDYAMPNSCAVSCHRGFENGAEPIFGTGADLSLSDWAEPEDVALAEALMQYYGPCGEWWNQGEAVPGDVDNSCSLDILDVVQIVGYILGTQAFTAEQIAAADFDGSGSIDILDIVGIIDVILNGRIDKGEPVKSAQIMIESNQVNLTVDGKVAGVQLSVTGDFTIVTSNVSDGWDIQSSDNTILLYSTDGSPLQNNALFSFEGSLTIESGIVADWHGDAVALNTSVIPDTYVLNPAYPNPFNPTTTISFGLPEESNVQIRVHDMLGHEVAVLMNGDLSAGSHQIIWNAENFSSGVYLISMTSDNVSLMQKVMLVK